MHHLTGACVSGEGWPRLLVFPEGTCTNQKALISFKSGAFNPGKDGERI